MVSPSNEWDDVENGLEKGDTRLTVDPTYHEGSGGTQYERTVEEGDENSYALNLWEYPDTHNHIVTIKDPRVAWEVAHLLTHYIDERMVAGLKMTIQHPMEGGERINGMVENMEASDIVERLLGYDVQAIDHLL